MNLVIGGLLGGSIVIGGLDAGTSSPTPTPTPLPPFLDRDTISKHHPATYTLSSTPVLISAARRGRVLFVQLASGSNAYIGGIAVTSTAGIPVPDTSSPPFVDTTTSAAWYAMASSGSPVINVDEIY